MLVNTWQNHSLYTFKPLYWGKSINDWNPMVQAQFTHQSEMETVVWLHLYVHPKWLSSARRWKNMKTDSTWLLANWYLKKWNIKTLTLSTPALRILLPFLFHLSANIGPLCWPSVLLRFPKQTHESFKTAHTRVVCLCVSVSSDVYTPSLVHILAYPS